MVDFVCPECGSIDHIDGEFLRYPHQCPGCERIIQAAHPAPPAPDWGNDRINPIRVRLLPTDQWTARKRWLAPQSEARRRQPRFSWGIVVFPALFIPVLAVAAYLWVKNPAASELNSHLPQPQTAAQAAPAEQPAKTPEPAKPAHDAEKDSTHASRSAPAAPPVSNPGAEEQAGQDLADNTTAEVQPPEPDVSEPVEAKPPPIELAHPPPVLRGVTTARPLYPGVPVVAEPSFQGRPLVAMAAGDTLLILDRRAHNEWLHVIHVGSGREGWVRVSQVRITLNGQ